MNVLVVGNGLDVALGYPTRLINCGNWLKSKEDKCQLIDEKLTYINAHYNNNPLFDNGMWSELETNLPKVLKKLKRGKKQWHGGFLWYDIYHLFSLWVNHICFHVKEHAPCPVNMKEYHALKRLINSSKIDLIITFNYTDTLEKYFNFPSNRIIHIHINDEGKPVLGHKDIDAKNISNDSCRHFDTYSTKYPDDWFSKYKSKFSQFYNVTNISFLGLSYGSVDWPYYKYLNDMYLSNFNDKSKRFFSKSCIWNFYYHNKSDIKNAKRFFIYLVNNDIVHNENFNKHIIPDSKIN